MRIILALAALACASQARAAESTRMAFPAAGIAALAIEAPAGNIAVEAGSGEIAVEVTRFDPERCTLTMAPKDGTLLLKVETKSRTGIFRRGCEAGFKVTAPAALPVKVETGAGSILFDGLSGRVQANTGAGSIRGTLTSSKADVSTGAGSIDLSWKKSPAAGLIKADTGAGSIRFAFPAGTIIEANLSTGIGSLTNQLGDTKGAPLRVTASSGVGSVTIVKS